MINLILFGKPGSGKGTQAEFLKKNYNLVHISTTFLRNNIKNKTQLGLLAKSYIDKGGLVPDQVTIEMLINQVNINHDVNGFIFDGFPRTIPQAQAMIDAKISIEYVIEVAVPDNEIFRRTIN